jgi:hypothetical protein
MVLGFLDGLTFPWYGFVRDYEAISYQFTPTFFYEPQTLENL